MASGKYQQWLEPDGLLLLEGWARDGLTDEQIAHNMGIAAGTLYAWKKAHGEISKALGLIHLNNPCQQIVLIALLHGFPDSHQKIPGTLIG